MTRQDAPVSYEFVGQTQSSAQVQIVARVAGFLDAQVYTEGSLVKAGDVLFRQDPKPFQATLASAKGALSAQQARWQVAKDNLARVQPLVALNALAQKDLDDAVGQEKAAAAAVEMAKADVEQAELNLGYTTIRTPVAGASSYARVNVGSYVDVQNSLLTEVSPLDPIYVNFSISENDMLRRQVQQTTGELQLPPKDEYDVELILADGSIYGRHGRITFANADFNQQTGTFLRARDASQSGWPAATRPVRARARARRGAAECDSGTAAGGAARRAGALRRAGRQGQQSADAARRSGSVAWRRLVHHARPRSRRSGRRRRRGAAVARRTGQDRAGRGAARDRRHSNGPTPPQCCPTSSSTGRSSRSSSR